MRNRILPIFITLFIAAMALVSIQNALAAPDSEVNTGIIIDEGDTNVTITDSHLKITDPVSETATVTYTILTPPQYGNLTNETSFTQAYIDSNSLKYSHLGSEEPTDNFQFNVRNDTTIFYTSTFTITVTPVNDPPIAVTDVISVAENGTATTLFTPFGATSILSNDDDAENGTLLVADWTTPTHASSFTLNDDGTFTYVHNGDEDDTDSFTYTVCDDGTPMECDNSGEVNINISQVNDTPTLTISGILTENQTLTANLSDDDGLPVPGSITYQWQRSSASTGPWADISGATNTTYIPNDLDVNQYIRVTADYTDLQGTAESPDSTATGPIANVNDTPTLTISGTPTENQTLTANLSDDDGLPVPGSITYQWQHSTASTGPWADISGATNTTYIPDDVDVNQYVRVTADYTDLHTTAESPASTATGPIANVNDTPTLTITGTPTEDQTLTANLSDDDGLPAPGSITYQWQRSGSSGGPWSNISGTNNTAYTLGDLDVNQYIRVTATYIDLHTTAESPASTASGPIANINDTPALSFSGTETEDQTLTAILSDNDGLPGSVSYQWQRSNTGTGGWSNIPGATSNTYTLGDGDSSKYVRVRAIYTDQKGTAETPISAASGMITNINDTPSLTISGLQVEDQTLTANLSDNDGLPGSISYQWQRSNSGTGGWANIPGATNNTYILGDNDSLKYVRVQANYTDIQGTPETPSSSSTGQIGNANDVPMAYPDTYYLFEGEQITRNVTLNDEDVDGDIFYFIQNPSPPYPPPSHAAPAGFSQDSLGNITYKHDGSENFTDNFVYRICEHQNPSIILGCTHTTVTLIITPTNDAPTTIPDIFTVPRSETLDSSLESGQTSVISNDSDAEGNNLIVNTTPVTQPMYADSFTLNADGTFIYVHDDSSDNDDSFSYEVCDDGTPVECSVETVTINIGQRPTTFIYLPVVLNNYSPDEPNNGPCTAYPISLNSQYSFMPNDVEDWYRITLPSPTNLSVEVDKFALTGDLIVYRSNDCVIDSNDEVKNDGTSQSTKTVNWVNAPAGTYYIRVYTSNPNPSAQPYDLIISAP